MRKVLVGFAASATLLLAFGAGQAHATALDVARNTSCGKATCFDDKGVFTQTFSADAFHGPVTIGQLLLDRGVLGALDGQTFRISFQLNGAELGTWGKYNMGGIGGEELSFAGQTFTWNPEAGDLVLLLEIVQPPKAGAGGGGFFAALGAPGEGEQGPPDDGQRGGDFGGVETEAVTAVPEPGAWALMITGFGLAGAMVRRRRAVLPVQP
jgi:hypothetical protein